MDTARPTIYNFTQHKLVDAQHEDGIMELPEGAKAEAMRLLNFDSKPTAEDIRQRAQALAAIAEENKAYGAMLGGATYLIPSLCQAMKEHGVRVYFAYSKRVSEERITPSGEVEKVAFFRYAGLIEL